MIVDVKMGGNVPDRFKRSQISIARRCAEWDGAYLRQSIAQTQTDAVYIWLRQKEEDRRSETSGRRGD